jgi:hypothetical protein
MPKFLLRRKDPGQGICHETTRNGTKGPLEFLSGVGSSFVFFVQIRGWFGCGSAALCRLHADH